MVYAIIPKENGIHQLGRKSAPGGAGEGIGAGEPFCIVWGSHPGQGRKEWSILASVSEDSIYKPHLSVSCSILLEIYILAS